MMFLASNSRHNLRDQKWSCPCYHARHLQQIHWSELLCRMYGLTAKSTFVKYWWDHFFFEKSIGFLLFGPYFTELSVRRTCVIESQDLKNSALFCCPFDRFKIKLIELNKSLDQLANRLFVKFGYCVDKLAWHKVWHNFGLFW